MAEDGYVLTLNPGVSFEEAVDFYTIGLGGQCLKKRLQYVLGQALGSHDFVDTAALSLAGVSLLISKQPVGYRATRADGRLKLCIGLDKEEDYKLFLNRVITVSRMNKVKEKVVVDGDYADTLYKPPTAIIHDAYAGFEWLIYVAGNEKQPEDFKDDEVMDKVDDKADADATTEGDIVPTPDVYVPVDIKSAYEKLFPPSVDLDLDSYACRYVLTLHPRVSFEQAVDFYTIGLGAQCLEKKEKYVQGEAAGLFEFVKTASLSLAGVLLVVSEQPQGTFFTRAEGNLMLCLGLDSVEDYKLFLERINTVNLMNKVTDVVDVDYADSLYKAPSALISDPYAGFQWMIYVKDNEKQKEEFSDYDGYLDDYKPSP